MVVPIEYGQLLSGLCAFGWLAHSRNSRLRLFTEDTSPNSEGAKNLPKMSFKFSVWYAGIGMAPLVAVLALALFAFYTSLGGQKVFQGSLLED